MKYKIFTVTALTGGALAELLGGWDKALQTLLIFIGGGLDHGRDTSAGSIWQKPEITKWSTGEQSRMEGTLS